MPPKKAAGSTSVYIVLSDNGIDSVHASLDSANARSTDARSEGKDTIKVEVQTLIGGTISITEPAKPAAKVKAQAPKATSDDAAAAPKANTAAKKTKTPAEQRATNAEKPKGKADDENLPENVKALLKGEGEALSGMSIVVTGVPPTLGRKNAEKLVESYGGKLAKSLSKKTSLVVVGNDAGPKKLEQIAELDIKTVDEDGLIALLEGGGGSAKRGADDDEDDNGEKDEKPARAKKQKK